MKVPDVGAFFGAQFTKCFNVYELTEEVISLVCDLINRELDLLNGGTELPDF